MGLAYSGIHLFDELTEYLRAKREVVDARLNAMLRPADGWPAPLLEAVRYSLLAPGKRLRPLLVLLATEASGGTEEAALPAACAVELVHTYSLVHDDLPAMDDDDLRRGLPTCHKRFGEALAILAGDALLTLAFQVLAESYPAATTAACCRELATRAGGAGMVGGQVLDLTAEGRIQTLPSTGPEASARAAGSLADASGPVTRAEQYSVLEGIHARKTGALFRACLRMGAWVAQGEQPGGPERTLLDRLDAFGRCFGQMFQITDDLLDVEGTAELIGKGVQKDAVRGKLTYPGLLGMKESRERAAQLGQEAQAHVQPLGKAGRWLALLAQHVLARDR